MGAKVQCPSCRCANPDRAKYCIECGGALGVSCPKCATLLPSNARFCFECGAAVERAEAVGESPKDYIPKHLADRILAARQSLIGERKQVTVLFADVKGSTGLIADRDAEQADALLHPIVSLMMDAVHRYEGTVTRVAGDGIMALFGAPIAHEDHGVRACFAALVMQRTVRDHNAILRREQGLTVQIRVGLNSGEAVVRSIGNDLFMEYTAMGKTAHLAARMEQLADPGSILMSGVTLRLAEGFVEVEDLGRVPVKGFEEPVEVFELTGAHVARRRFEAAALRGLTSFVGRDAELKLIEQACGKAKEGHGQMVAVVGEAALGKSRLFYEFTRSPGTTGCRVLQGSSSSFGKTTPFLPVIELLKDYFDVEAADPPRAIQEKVGGRILALDRSLTSCLPAFLSLLDVPVNDSAWESMDVSEHTRRTLDACKRLLLREGQETPLVVVFEDLHWVDSKTQAMLDSLVDGLSGARILLLVNYRPEYQHAWGGRTFYTQIHLEPLSSESARKLLDLQLGCSPTLDALKQQLILQTEGNPFFLEESARTLIETGVLAGEPRAYRLQHTVSKIEVPATVQAVLAARIDRLSAPEKLVLQTASVVGETFTFAMLAAITEQPEAELRSILDHLQGVEFLYETALFPEYEYTFKHGLTYQVTYNSLLRERRSLLHARILDILEAEQGDRRSEEINRFAHHAYEGGVWPKALLYLREAGTKAARRSAYDEAVTCFERALTALAHLPESRDTLSQALDIQLDLRTSLFPLGRHAQVLDRLRQASELSDKLEDPARRAWVSIYQCHYFWIMGKPAEALRQARSAQSMARNLSRFSLDVTVNYYLGLACLSTGEYQNAAGSFRDNVDALKGDASRERYGVAGYPAAMSATYLAWALAECGGFSEGLRVGRAGVLLAKELNHAWTTVTAYHGLAALHIAQGDAEAAVNLLEHALPLSGEWHLDAITPSISAALGYAHAMSGRLDQGLSMLERGIEDTEASGRLVFHALFKVYLGEVLLKMEKLDRAAAAATQALSLARERGEQGVEAMALRLAGELGSREPGAAGKEPEALYDESIRLAEKLAMRPLTARCRLGLGDLHRRRGEHHQARDAYHAALAAFRELQMHHFAHVADAALRDG